ncbi:MAG: hypothetical protein ACFFBC_08005 [Promethearchaeota archaeon]
MDLYFNDIDLFYSYIDHYFRDKIVESFGSSPIAKEDMVEVEDEITLFLIKVFVELGFELNEVEAEFLDPFLEIKEDDFQVINSPVDLYERKIAPILYEIFLEKIVDYLVDTQVAPLMLKFKDEGFLPIAFIMELRNLKNLIENDPEKHENLRKYIQIQKYIINKFWENKKRIESLEDIEGPQLKLQINYLIYRIIHFFHLQIAFDFSHIKSYLKENVDEWLIEVPLVTLKNPEIYFCGIYLAEHLGVDLDVEKIRKFLLALYDHTRDRYITPLIEATDGVYYFIKSTDMMKLWLNSEQINGLIQTDPEYFDPNYLKNLETSQLVVILKLYRNLGIKNMESEANAITEEIEKRIASEGIKQFRDGFISSEATYYVLFSHYMNSTLEKLKEHDILENVVLRIYRNLGFLDFSIDTNFDLISELFYSLESLKLFNCIETKEMIIHLAKFLFPQEVVKKISAIKEISNSKAKFRHLKVNRVTGETIY